MPLVLFVDDQIFEQDNKSALGRADGEKQIDHADNGTIPSQHEYTAATGLFENQTQAAKLFIFVGSKVALLREQSAQHLGQFVQIGLGPRFDYDFLARCWHGLFPVISKIGRDGNPRMKETAT